MLAGLVSLGGCVGYDSYPSQSDRSVLRSPASGFMLAPVAEAVRWASVRYPVEHNAEWRSQGEQVLAAPADHLGGPFAVNLPQGVSHESYVETMARIGPLAHALTPETEVLPTFHVLSVWVQGDVARVELLRPVPGMTRADGSTVHQPITVKLRGGFRPWRKTFHRVWAMDSIAEPPANYLPYLPIDPGDQGAQQTVAMFTAEPEPGPEPAPDATNAPTQGSIARDPDEPMLIEVPRAESVAPAPEDQPGPSANRALDSNGTAGEPVDSAGDIREIWVTPEGEIRIGPAGDGPDEDEQPEQAGTGVWPPVTW